MRNYDIPAAYRQALFLKEEQYLFEAHDWYSRALSSRSRRVRRICCTMGDLYIARADKLHNQLEKIVIVRPNRN